MRDYSEKRGGREIDRSKPVAKNRPRKESGGLFTFLAFLVIVLVYAAGVLTGWFVFKGSQKAPAVAAAQPAKKPDAAPAPEQPKPDAPLTFYKTLPQGGKGVIGTGLNLKKPEQPHGAPSTLPAAAPEPAASEPAAPATPTSGAAAPASAAAQGADAAGAKAENPARFVVQVASYKEKQEAVAAQGKLSAKGLPAYLVESRVPDKGVWYRLRVGRHLTKPEADGMAAKAGKGSIVLAE